ncbi:MAG TPA: FKBP-type peptidyl-prolyl cis-trans isomerase [Vicinamibacteria bacterium]|nr:FKBP-type peptidyl-prolyl cis-trans isomerase [Vicinamibacteria bacterium]
MGNVLKPGVEVLEEDLGSGAKVEKRKFYRFRIRMWLSRGDPVRWSRPWGLIDRARIDDEGTTLVTDLRVDREFMFSGLFYGVQGMFVGGTRKLRVAPHLAYGEKGVPGSIPPNALLTIEVHVFLTTIRHRS